MAEGGGRPESGSGSKPASLVECSGDRVRFTVELNPDETTVVSWTKLLREANLKSKGPGSSSSGPSFEAQIQPVHQRPMENEAEDAEVQTGPNRLSNVIEKIERMYAGNGSGDEEDLVLDNMPDDDEYDTDDSFIDDTELDDYFQVDNSKIKHDGFFINRGKLERTEPIISTNQQPKKRSRKDLTKVDGWSDDGHNSNEHVKVENKGRKVSSKIQRNSTSQSHRDLPNMHDQDLQFQNLPVNAPEASLKKKTADSKTTVDTLGLPNGEAISQDKETDQHRPHALSSKDHVRKWKESSELQDMLTQRSGDKISQVRKAQSGKQPNNVGDLGQSNQRKDKGPLVEKIDHNVSASRESLPTTVAVMQRKEGSRRTMLEKAIRELEKIVAEYRPPSTEVQDPDNSSQAVKKRLPSEIKQQLAKVARITQSGYKCIPKEVINHLMSIVGHLMQVRTLKRNLRVMASTGLSVKQEKDDRVQKIKQEVAEMVKSRVPYMNRSEEKEALKQRYRMDDALEDRICELYDLYVERLEEDSGPPVRRLYEELIVFWPAGFMDIIGIKRAIHRAKERKGLYSMQREQQKIKRRKTFASKPDGASNVNQALHINEKLPVSPSLPFAFGSGSNIEKPKQRKMKGSSTSNPINAMPSNVLPKKKVNKKPSSEVVETQFRLEKLAVSQVDAQDKHRKHTSGSRTKNAPSSVPSGSDYMS